jgi:DNA mismatch repair protein MutL
LRAALGRADLFGGRLAGYPAARETASAAETAVPADWRDVLGRGAGWFGRETLPPYAADDASESPESRGGDWAWPRDLAYLGQVGRTFLVARAADGLYVIDQHAAHERVVLERLVAAGAGEVDPEARTDQQLLAVPVTVELAPGEEDVLERSLAFLRRVGFELEAFGGRTVLIRAVPAVLSGVPVGGLIADFLDRLGAEGGPGTGAERAGVPGARGSLAASFDRFRAARVMAACQASLKAGQGLSEAEAEALLGDLGRTSEPRTCPHGRPTLLRIGLDELERSFGRGRG